MGLSVPTDVDGVGVYVDIHEVVHDFTLDVILHPINQETTAHIDDLDEGQVPVGQGEKRKTESELIMLTQLKCDSKVEQVLSTCSDISSNTSTRTSEGSRRSTTVPRLHKQRSKNKYVGLFSLRLLTFRYTHNVVVCNFYQILKKRNKSPTVQPVARS